MSANMVNVAGGGGRPLLEGAGRRRNKLVDLEVVEKAWSWEGGGQCSTPEGDQGSWGEDPGPESEGHPAVTAGEKT